MAKRREPTNNDHILLVNEVDSLCPVCGKSIMYSKAKSQQKGYDVAHIYPLNPTKAEVALLAGEERLHADVNNNANLIPICKDCHKKYDRPRTVHEYRNLVSFKKNALRRSEEMAGWASYRLENEIEQVVKALLQVDAELYSAELSFDAKSARKKLGDEFAPLLRNRILEDIRSYFSHIKTSFSQLDTEAECSAELIASQVRTYYLSQKNAGSSKEGAYTAVAHWIRAKTHCDTHVAEIVASFFVQSCEVLE